MTELPDCVLVDIDGTVALMGKGIEGRRGPYDLDRVSEDDPNEPIIDLVRVLRAAGYPPVFLSGRDDHCWTETLNWLVDVGASDGNDPLFMRTTGDYRADTIVKRELYEEHVVPYWRVKWVLDDRNSVVRMWRDELGLTTLQVADGDF